VPTVSCPFSVCVCVCVCVCISLSLALAVAIALAAGGGPQEPTVSSPTKLFPVFLSLSLSLSHTHTHVSTAYADAGADAILVHSKKKEATEIEAFMKAWNNKAPVVIVPTNYYTTPTDNFRSVCLSVSLSLSLCVYVRDVSLYPSFSVGLLSVYRSALFSSTL
jgi:hypothetical protein